VSIPTTPASRDALEYGVRLAQVVHNHVEELDLDPDALTGVVGRDPTDLLRRLSGCTPMTVWDVYQLSRLFGMQPSDLLREAESRR